MPSLSMCELCDGAAWCRGSEGHLCLGIFLVQLLAWAMVGALQSSEAPQGILWENDIFGKITSFLLSVAHQILQRGTKGLLYSLCK